MIYMIHPTLRKKQRIIIVTLVILISLTTMISIGMGASSLSYNRIIPTIFGQGTFKEEFVLFSIRLPRIIITILAGMALALSGAILQSITRNDLADPGIIGINSGAGVAIEIGRASCRESAEIVDRQGAMHQVKYRR